ncbi:MAG TPA: hypothetical protein VF540_11385 [Segetibacter sp.]
MFNLFFITAISAQSVTGLWYGVGQVSKFGDNNAYLSELKLKQTGKKVTGEFNYFFRRTEIKTKISGTYDSKTRTLFLNTSPVLNFQAKNENGADCPMKGLFKLTASRVETTLSGQFMATKSYKLTCPDITVRFVKGINEQPVPSDTTEEEIAGVTAVIKKEERPAVTPVIKKEERPAVTPVTKKEDTASVTPVAPKKQTDPNKVLVAALNNRAFDISPVIDVDSDSLKVTLYDNGEVDNDTISLFYNRKLVAAKKMLSDKPLTFTLAVDTTVNEIAMYAENLGKLPPNTALAVIYAGGKRFELGMTSTFIKNATIRFRYKPKTSDPKNIN